MSFNKFMRLSGKVLFLVLAVFLVFNISCFGGTDTYIEKDLTKISLEQSLRNGKPTLADFGWRNCIPCKMMKPVLETLAEKQRGQLNVLIVEVYEHEDLMDQYGIKSIPTQILFDSQGKELMRHLGYWAPEEMALELKKVGVN
ncbi:MAG: thioredoxin family protein [Chloroflexi bacterium]|nr:thioredoxin family protein [Chloroflexota bacterium]